MVTVSAIANASQGELLCITYELFLYNIEEALKIDGEEREEHIYMALEVIKTLVQDLNFEVPITNELFRLYIYVQGILLTYKVTNEKLEHAYKIIEPLYKGFSEIAQKGEQTSPSMKNIETIYAGLTYGKNDLNEMVIGDSNRGFKA